MNLPTCALQHALHGCGRDVDGGSSKAVASRAVTDEPSQLLILVQ
jgi:hypothetical protein